MESERDRKIRERAHELWVAGGAPGRQRRTGLGAGRARDLGRAAVLGGFGVKKARDHEGCRRSDGRVQDFGGLEACEGDRACEGGGPEHQAGGERSRCRAREGALSPQGEDTRRSTARQGAGSVARRSEGVRSRPGLRIKS
jgi:hypothetical protein